MHSVAIAEDETAPKLEFKTIIKSMMEDSRGNLWIGSDREGVCRFDGKAFTYFTEGDGLSHSQIRFIQEEKNGVIWFGTGNGVCSYDASVTHSPGKPKIIHHQVEPAEKGSEQADTGWKNAADHLWFDIGNREGVCRWDGHTLKKVFLPLLKGSDSKYSYVGDMTDIAYGANSQLWISSYPGVLGHNDAGFTMLQNQRGYHVRSVYEASDGTLWIGCNGIGALTYDGITVTNFTEKHNVGAGHLATGSVPSVPRTLRRIFAISEDKDQNMWFGTVDAGIWRYDGEELTNFTHKDGLTSFECQCIYRDKKGEMWFGMGNGTICKFDGERFQTAF